MHGVGDGERIRAGEERVEGMWLVILGAGDTDRCVYMGALPVGLFAEGDSRARAPRILFHTVQVEMDSGKGATIGRQRTDNALGGIEILLAACAQPGVPR